MAGQASDSSGSTFHLPAWWPAPCPKEVHQQGVGTPSIQSSCPSQAPANQEMGSPDFNTPTQLYRHRVILACPWYHKPLCQPYHAPPGFLWLAGKCASDWFPQDISSKNNWPKQTAGAGVILELMRVTLFISIENNDHLSWSISLSPAWGAGWIRRPQRSLPTRLFCCDHQLRV